MKKSQLTFKSLLACASALIFSGAFLSGCSNEILKSGEWCLSYDTRTGGVDITRSSKLLYDNVYTSYKLSDKLVSTLDYSKRKITIENINDTFGKGSLYRIVHTSDSLPKLTQFFYVYPTKDYVLTDFTLEDKFEVASNYMAPVNVDRMPTVLNKGKNNRSLFIPFDNDKWIRYQSHPLTFDSLTSYEVTAIFNNDDRNSLVVGSVEHDKWKSAITIGKGNIYNVGSLVCYGGAADELTRDSKAHGALKGKKIKSPKVLLGFFKDWREGMEEYANANAIIAPPKAWNKAVPFGWNSWGALQFGLTYPKALEVSDYFKNHLQNNNFENTDRTVYIGLDSGWNNFSEEELKAFVNKCKTNGQVAGVYWTPFTDWGKNPERELQNIPGYKYKDIYAYANGKPQELDGAFAVDPTHPAVEEMMKKTAALFHQVGFEYVKMDFMTHGAMEADKWYNPQITTGIQGYNYGMKLLNKYFGDMYINLSISPIFPAHYAQSRRIACDAWNKMKDTEYTLNALSYGWWQDKIYQFNDADHIVLRGATDGENRARVTSGIITGIYIVGDDFSAEGTKEGKDKAQTYLTNAEVNAVATGEAFRPIDGNGDKSENKFVRINKNGICYCAIFNYLGQDQIATVNLDDLQLEKTKEYKVKELWRGTQTTVKGMMEVTVPAQDVMLFEIQ